VEKETKPNCYECEYRGCIPGDAHSCCNHPENKNINDPMTQLMAILGNAGRVTAMQHNSKIKVVGNPHGIRNGWFCWPINFDPTWLESCNGFKQKENK
jgi:hypothetical protein